MSTGRQESGMRGRRLPGFGWAAALAARVRRLAEAMAVWPERLRTRRRLAHLSDHILKDIGVSRAAMARETEKPFWRK